ncbi:competence type IV pilus major pilin ComGC [Sediminibacillus massiliensis]|uniref:competence type IV pilus major pilin ComGC n=1 Tax=Sediminibacillus massiliensis TaxID=1926277 RepID=UPI0009887CEB|nr:competence type IV pilus major pilin ComGC [Sediminibacillus massiliensis]
MKNQRGFTLIEMLLVLTVISVLMILIIPNLAHQNEEVQSKGCDALIEMATGQMTAYKLEYGSFPQQISELENENYLKSTTCDGGSKSLAIESGEIVLVEQ